MYVESRYAFLLIDLCAHRIRGIFLEVLSKTWQVTKTHSTAIRRALNTMDSWRTQHILRR